jgi:Tfp pilus assembly protein PilO
MMRLLLQFTFAFLVTSVLLMGYVTHVHDDENFLREVDKEKEQLKEQIREQKLRVMQATMFRNYRRPPDSTYNINVTLSDITPLDREIEDTRPMACREIKVPHVVFAGAEIRSR